jgi:hypothetical protein
MEVLQECSQGILWVLQNPLYFSVQCTRVYMYHMQATLISSKKKGTPIIVGWLLYAPVLFVGVFCHLNLIRSLL